MNKIISFIAEAPYRMLAVVTIGLTTTANVATAATGGSFGDVALKVNGTFSSMGKMVLGGSMVAGLGLSGAGLLKLKAAADSGGQQVKYSEGLWRLGVGAGLVALPAMITTTLNTGGLGTDGGSVNIGSVNFNR